MQLAAAADPVAAAHHEFGHRTVGHRIGNISRSGAELVASLLAKVSTLIDGGVNCPADPIVRAKDFANLSLDQWGRRVGSVRGMSEAARQALRVVVPVALGGEPTYILGDSRATFYRASTVARFTDAEATRQRAMLAEAERIREGERLAWERGRASQPDVLAARVRELEAQVAARPVG